MSSDSRVFLEDFRTLSTFGATPGGGVDRQAGTEADGAQRRWLAEQLQAHGLRVEYDAVGNQYGLLELVAGAPYVLIGSHLDSQPLAGRYDGAYGVLAAAHAAFRLAEEWAATSEGPCLNLAVVNWFNEEGSRFKPSMMGSAVFTGKLSTETALSTTDVLGISVRETLESIGCLGEFLMPPVAAYAEIHVEQGRTMERDGITIGLVDSTWGANKYEILVRGEQAHAGSTIMSDRRDALLGASMIVVAARELADKFVRAPLHTSVGEMHILPNSPVVVARQVNLLLDLRSPQATVLAEADAELQQRIVAIEGQAKVKCDCRISHTWDVESYQPEGVALAQEVAAALGLPHANVQTVAGHDSTNLKDLVPTVMLFVPSVDGVSHNEREYTRDEDVLAGLHMLTETARRMCKGALGTRAVTAPAARVSQPI